VRAQEAATREAARLQMMIDEQASLKKAGGLASRGKRANARADIKVGARATPPATTEGGAGPPDRPSPVGARGFEKTVNLKLP